MNYLYYIRELFIMIVKTESNSVKNCGIRGRIDMYPFYEKNNCNLRFFVADTIQFPAHLHSDVELFLVLEGKMCLEVGSEKRVLKKGECAVIFPEEVHRYMPEEENKGLLLIFNPAVSDAFRRMFQKYRPESPFVSEGENPRDVWLAVQRLLENQTQQEFPICNAWLQVLLANLFPMLTLKERKQGENMNLAYRIIQYVANHFQEPLTLEVLAKELHVNKYYLSHTISDCLQMNFREYLNEIRLDYAMQLIRSTDLTLTRIWGKPDSKVRQASTALSAGKWAWLQGSTEISDIRLIFTK